MLYACSAATDYMSTVHKNYSHYYPAYEALMGDRGGGGRERERERKIQRHTHTHTCTAHLDTHTRDGWTQSQTATESDRE